jgi:hypothetical protein
LTRLVFERIVLPMVVRKALMLAACVAAGCTDRPAGAADPAQGHKEQNNMAQGTREPDGVRNLPSSFGRSFTSLDEYLEHLRLYAGPVDQPWYREIRPGVYELETTMTPRSAPRTFTRAQLMREFGFTR